VARSASNSGAKSETAGTSGTTGGAVNGMVITGRGGSATP
jgi:hypothetical protein